MYGTFLSSMPCSPQSRPLSDANTIRVSDSRPVSASAATRPATASSTAISACCWRRAARATFSAWAGRGPAPSAAWSRRPRLRAGPRGRPPRAGAGARAGTGRAGRRARTRGRAAGWRGRADDVGGGRGQHVGGVVTRRGPVHAAVAERVVVVVAGPVHRGERQELVPAGRPVARRRVQPEGVEVLPDQGGPVALLLQRHGHRALLVAAGLEGPPAAVRPHVGPHPGVVGVAARQHRRAARAAQRGRDHGPREGGARSASRACTCGIPASVSTRWSSVRMTTMSGRSHGGAGPLGRAGSLRRLGMHRPRRSERPRRDGEESDRHEHRDRRSALPGRRGRPASSLPPSNLG